MHKKRENADHITIRVKNHKAFATAGPALLVLNAKGVFGDFSITYLMPYAQYFCVMVWECNGISFS